LIRRLTDGTRLHYEVHGDGDPAMVFVHGWCSNLRHWNAQVRHFVGSHRVLAVDRRGHGRSDVPATGYTAVQHAADLAEVCRAEHVTSAVVVGHAGGGPATLELARSCPDIVRAVVMVDGIVGPQARIGDPTSPSGTALGAMIDRLRGPEGAAAFAEIYRGFFSAHAGASGRQAMTDAQRVPLAVAAAELEGIAVDTAAIARELFQPVLWLTVVGADQPAVRAAFRDVQFGQVVGSGHFPHLEVPEQVNAMIARFVSAI